MPCKIQHDVLDCGTRDKTLTTTNQPLMDKPQRQTHVFHLCQYTERHGHQVVYQLITSQNDADELADGWNEQLAERGIPGSICAWYITGPHQNTSQFN